MALTYGSAGQPAQSTFNYDSLIASSLANYRNTLIDNVSASNAFFYKLYKSGQWESRDGGLYVAEDLMYGLTPVDSYSGYDELPTNPPEGLTQAQFQWAQCAAPIAISEEERKKNKHRIVDLITSRIMQAEIGIKEFWAKGFLQGSLSGSGSSLKTPYVSAVNGSSFVDPLPKLVDFVPTGSATIGGIAQNTASNAFWRNRTVDLQSPAVTTYLGYIATLMNLRNTCSRGPGGPPDLGVCDQVSWELLALAYYAKYLANMPSNADFPFANVKLFDTLIVWDEFMGDVKTDVTSTATYGSLYLLNTKFFKVCYESETNFVPTDFQRPVNQDAKVKHILWMGATTVNNRRKHGVAGGIPRSLS